MPRVAPVTDDTRRDALLADIEATLIRAIPKQLQAMTFAEPAYGLFVCYIDLTTDSYAPMLKLCPESFLRRAVADRSVDVVWRIAELPGPLLPVAGLTGKCNAVYEYLARDFGEPGHDDELAEILPFRRMIYRVCLALNALDWSGVMPVTPEFTVMACDWSYGQDARADADASVPAARKRFLKKRGLYFNPEALPEAKVPAGNPISRMATATAAEQLPYWHTQLLALSRGEDCDAARAKWGPKRLVAALVKLGEPGGEALVSLMEELAATKSFGLFGDLRDGVEVVAPKDAATERRLWAVFEACVAAQAGRERWDDAPADVAFAIYKLHRGKYSYSVIRRLGFNDIVSLDQIRQQARQHGMI